MDIRSQKIFEALFKLEDLRQIIRDSAPGHDFSDEEDKRFESTIADLRNTIDELEQKKGQARITRIGEKIYIRDKEEDYININPIQSAGRLTADARKALIAYGDGYSVCDYCLKPFRLDYIKKPPIQEFYQELAEFVGMDSARVVRGARRGFQIVAGALLKTGDTALIAQVGHYSLALAIESSGADWKEIELNERNIITAEKTEEKIKQVKKETGKLPKLIAIPHIDYSYGNMHEVKEIADVAHSFDIPFLYNGAYTVGTMPVDGRKIGADFIIGSGHKSMAAPAPTGVLAVTEEYAEKIFRPTERTGDVTGRKFGIKEIYLLGCTVMGAPLIAMMASFPHVKERVSRWDEELEKANYFLKEFLRIEDNQIITERPRNHTMTRVDSTATFNEIAKSHKKRGFFLSHELSKKKVTGLIPGTTREYKLNTYGLSWKQVKYLSNAFLEIAESYDLTVNSK